MNQNQQLEEIETTTLSNLDETKDMTDEVTEEVKGRLAKSCQQIAHLTRVQVL
jgi:hypothetical protein